jgi:hypothetical protein
MPASLMIAPRARAEAAHAAVRPLEVRESGAGLRTCPCGGGCPRCAGGAPLYREDRRWLEARFGRPFGDVRVHTGSGAATAAARLGARAYTVGSDIVFARDEYRPRSRSGRELLAHEAAHVVQQFGARTSPGTGAAPHGAGRADDRFEREAAAAARAALAGGTVAIRERTPAPLLQRAAPAAAAPGVPQITMPDGKVLDGALLDAMLLKVPAIATWLSQGIASGGGAAGRTWLVDEDDFIDRFVLYAVPPGGQAKANPRIPGTTFDPVTARAFAKSVNGYHAHDTGEIYVKLSDKLRDPSRLVPTAVHEAVHLQASISFASHYGFNISEGLTDFFTLQVCQANDIDPGALAYDAQRAAVQPIFDLGYLTLEEMAEWYFSSPSMYLFSDRHKQVAHDWTAFMRDGGFIEARRVLKQGAPAAPLPAAPPPVP